jgi:L-ascorbate metabolism protein UlaG (beta-lactamase superfamily)
MHWRALRTAPLCGVFLCATVGAQVAADRYSATGGDIEITPLLHASVKISHGGRVIYVDPWSAADLSRATPADLILITDDPAHHLDVKAIAQLRKPSAPVVMPASGTSKVPDGHVLRNGAAATFAGVRVESIAAYDLTPGEPEHPKGEANGYVVTLGGKRLYFAGVTECVPELLALGKIDIAFVPMNIPPSRMAPRVVADCMKRLRPAVVYVYHYDQALTTWITNRATPRPDAAAAQGIARSLQEFKQALAAEPIDVRLPDWYSRYR